MIFRRRSRPRNRRKEGSGWLRRVSAINWRRLLPAGAVVLAVAAVIGGTRWAMDQPVERVDISGRFQRVQALDVQKAVRTVLGGKGMVGVELDAVSEAVRQIPWVERATVARSWPRGLSIQVVEQQPVARWGEAGLLNSRGEVFVRDSRHLTPELPEFAGPVGSEAQMTARYLAIQPQLASAGLRLSRMRLDERGAWEIQLDNGVQLRLGREQFDQRFDRFIAAAARIVSSRATEIRYVDLRYANGFAIGWRAGGGGVIRG
jgi:cell division protein FtsQ